MPPSRSRTGQSKTVTTNPNANPPTNTVITDIPVVRKVLSSGPSKPLTTPFAYRIKTWTYKGQVYTRTAGWVFPPKKPKVQAPSWRPPKPYACTLQEGDITHFNGTDGYAFASNPGITVYTVGDLPVASSRYPVGCPAIPSFDSGLESRAVIKALSKLKENKVNLAVAFFERAETAELLVGTLAGLAKAARSLRNGDMRGVAKGLGLSGKPKAPKGQNFPQKWLELQYGWRPLYNDVFDAVSALHAADQAVPDRYAKTVTGSVKVKREVNAKPIGSGGAQTLRCATRSREEEGCFVRLDYYLTNPFLASLSALGITNPAEVIWERVPFSFAIDWFLPVGNYLSGFDAALGYEFRAGSCSRLFRRDWEGWIYPSRDNPLYIPQVVTGTCRTKQMALTRTVYSSSPLPRIPSFKNPFPYGSTHIANAIALLASSLRG